MSEAVEPSAAPAAPPTTDPDSEPTEPVADAEPDAPEAGAPEAEPDTEPEPDAEEPAPEGAEPAADEPAPAPPRAAARVVAVTKVYGSGDTAVRALDGVSVNFQAGRFTAIMGPSGSGKSTLMHCVAGLDSVTSGKVYLDETDLTELDDRALTRVRREQIGFVFQSFNLIPTLTALENITLPLDLAGREHDEGWIQSVVRTVRLGDRLHHRPAELSGGQQQRVAVARALAGRPKVIFADEPTGNLDSRAGTEILRFMRQAVIDLEQTIVMVTHDPVAASYANRVLFLADGQIVSQLFEPTSSRIIDHMKALGDS